MRGYYDLDRWKTPVVYFRNKERYRVIAVSDEESIRSTTAKRPTDALI